MSDEKAPDMITEAHRLAREIDDDQELLRRLNAIKPPPKSLKDIIAVILMWGVIIGVLFLIVSHRQNEFDVEEGGKIYFIHYTKFGFSYEKLPARISGEDVEI